MFYLRTSKWHIAAIQYVSIGELIITTFFFLSVEMIIYVF